MRVTSGIMCVLPLLFLLALLLDRHMVSDGATRNCSYTCVMMREVTGRTADNSTFEATCLGGYDICTAQGQNHWDNTGTLRHLRLLDIMHYSTKYLLHDIICSPGEECQTVGKMPSVASFRSKNS